MADRKRRVPRLQTKIEGPTLTKQSFAAECDINNIMKRFERDGVIDHLKQHGGQYADLVGQPEDFRAAMQMVVDAERLFSMLPAKVRKEFDNDPAAFLDAFDAAGKDEEARKRLETLGVLQAAVEPSKSSQDGPAEPVEAPSEEEPAATA